MAIDWHRYKPEEALGDLEVSMIREIAGSYFNKGEGVPDHQKRVALGKNRHVLQKLSQRGYIRNISNRYYPTFQAVYFFKPDLQRQCETTVESLLRALKILYERTTGPTGEYTLEQISDAIKNFGLGDWTLETVRRGALFLADFQGSFFHDFKWGLPSPVQGVCLMGDNILDFENLEEAWQMQWNLRHPAQQTAVSPPPAQSGETADPESQGFSFVADERLRQIVHRDHGELQKLKGSNALKSRVVLAGGLIEAVLLDALMQNAEGACASREAQRKDGRVKPLEAWDLAHLIDVAVELKLVSEDAKKHSQTIREYRNLVHPGLELRSRHTLRLEVANIAEEVLAMVISDIRAWKSGKA